MKRPVTRRAALLATPLLVLPALSHAAPPATWPTSLTIATASPGGTYVVYGDALAKILNETLDVPISTQATQGVDQNIVLLETGRVQLTFVTLGPAQQAWTGTGDWTRGKQYRALRALFPMYDTTFQIVASKDSGIRSVTDMAGKRVGAGPKGGTSGTYFPAIFKALDVAATVRHGSWTELASQLPLRLLDVLTAAVGLPTPFVADLDRQIELTYIAFTAAEVASLRKTMPELSPSVIPAGTYASLKAELPTVGMFNFAVAHKDLPDDLVYAILKATFEHRDRLIAAHPSAGETVTANVSRNGVLPFHPGAVRYYRENGIAIPDNPTTE
jgi:TRAP transporter TAXI family solute receptor